MRTAVRLEAPAEPNERRGLPAVVAAASLRKLLLSNAVCPNDTWLRSPISAPFCVTFYLLDKLISSPLPAGKNQLSVSQEPVWRSLGGMTRGRPAIKSSAVVAVDL